MGKTLDTGIAIVERALQSDTIGKFFCGEYTDGTVRSIPDAIRGEETSPKDKKKERKKKKKKGNQPVSRFEISSPLGTTVKHKKHKKKKHKGKKKNKPIPKKLVL